MFIICLHKTALLMMPIIPSSWLLGKWPLPTQSLPLHFHITMQNIVLCAQRCSAVTETRTGLSL